MTNTNDVRILEMRKLIEEKKEKLGKASRFSPVTNCSIEVDGVRFNINVLDKEKLLHLLIKLTSYYQSARVLGVVEEAKYSGYTLEEWVTDIRAKIDILSKKDEEKKLKLMEDKLVELLSEGKKVELEIDEIANSLK